MPKLAVICRNYLQLQHAFLGFSAVLATAPPLEGCVKFTHAPNAKTRRKPTKTDEAKKIDAPIHSD
jgi:hypothetical protein